MRLFAFMAMDELITTATMREKIDLLEAEILHLPQVDCPIKHHFAPGVYAREITIPANTLITGVVHKIDNLVILSKGCIRVATEDGYIEISAPHTFLCRAGTKNAVTAIEDSVWTNFFATTETDTDKLVELLTESTAKELLGGSENKQLAAIKAAEQLEN